MTGDITFQELDKDGVSLIRNCLDLGLLDALRTEYDEHDEKLDSAEIPKDKPIVVFWTHVQGKQKRILELENFPSLQAMIVEQIVPLLRTRLGKRANRLQLLETIIFNKPPTQNNALHWHQDVAYFPLKPNNQIAVWFPLEIVTAERGALCYAIGSHKDGAKGSTDLHTRKVFDNEDRPTIPEHPADQALEVRPKEKPPPKKEIKHRYKRQNPAPQHLYG